MPAELVLVGADEDVRRDVMMRCPDTVEVTHADRPGWARVHVTDNPSQGHVVAYLLDVVEAVGDGHLVAVHQPPGIQVAVLAYHLAGIEPCWSSAVRRGMRRLGATRVLMLPGGWPDLTRMLGATATV